MLLESCNTTSCEKTCRAVPIHHAAQVLATPQQTDQQETSTSDLAIRFDKEEELHDGIRPLYEPVCLFLKRSASTLLNQLWVVLPRVWSVPSHLALSEHTHPLTSTGRGTW